MKKAVIYTRTAVPNPASNKKQEELCLQFARNNGYEVALVYTDNGFSGMNAHRPSFRKLMDSRKSKDWDVIIVSDCSRFFRKPRSFVRYMKVLRRAGKDLISVRDGEFSYQAECSTRPAQSFTRNRCLLSGNQKQFSGG